uniref:15-hydroxyprostaglandin dehydrogenase [NAD(+)] n=1 Tax=Magallana gigas TaxID=29159 RepID=A0A8W8HMK5_MAGGI
MCMCLRCQVCLSDVVVDRLQATYEEFERQYGAENVHQIPCDVTDKTQVKDLFKGTVDTFGAIDIVFNNAVCGSFGDWEKVIQINQGCVLPH